MGFTIAQCRWATRLVWPMPHQEERSSLRLQLARHFPVPLPQQHLRPMH
jgi:hypothetical protein